MLETTHVLTALALAKNVQNPILAFGLGFVSHLILDAIPHYDFQGKILKPEFYGKEKYAFDKDQLSKTGKIVIFSDIAVSFLIFLYLSIRGPLWPGFPDPSSLFINLYFHLPWVLGVLGGIFPDILTLICFKTGFCWPKWFFEFHKRLQLSSLKTTTTPSQTRLSRLTRFDVAPKINAVFGLAFQIILILFGIYIFVK